MVKSRLHKASIESTVLTGAQMAIGVINYDWTDEPGEGGPSEGECCFGFLLQRSESEHVRWEKVDTQGNKETRTESLVLAIQP